MAYDAGGAVVVTSDARPRLFAAISSGSPTILPMIGLPLFITTNLPFLNVMKYWQLSDGVFPKFFRLTSNGAHVRLAAL